MGFTMPRPRCSTTCGATSPTTTTTPPTTTATGTGPDYTLAIVAGAVGAAVVILVGGFVLLRQK